MASAIVRDPAPELSDAEGVAPIARTTCASEMTLAANPDAGSLSPTLYVPPITMQVRQPLPYLQMSIQLFRKKIKFSINKMSNTI